MARNQVNPFDVDPHVAEIYDRVEYGRDDVAFILRLAAGLGPLKVLEPFCGSGRVLLPLAEAGYRVTGLDSSRAMLARGREKAARLPEEVRQRLELVEMDVTCWEDWPTGFDLVILGGNGLYELATPEEQASCVAAAAASLRPGGHVYLDSDHMEGVLDPNWRLSGEVRGVLTGECADGTYVENTLETTWYDAPRRLVEFRRRTYITPPAGPTRLIEFNQQKHPVSRLEAQSWLEQHGLKIEAFYGDRSGAPYDEAGGRMIFWAIKK
jgi:SAM-dependent methyltransferase